MNLEEELNMISDTTVTTEPVAQPIGVNPQPTATIPPAPPAPQPMPQPVAQPAMVNVSAAQNTVSQFNISSFDVSSNEKTGNSNPLTKLVGNAGETFRIHFLPGAAHKQVKVHWDQEKGHNFCCLAMAYGTGGSDVCCGTHGKAKTRFVIPVIVIPSTRGQVQQGVHTGELKVLVVSEKTRDDILDQALISGTTADNADFVAKVKDARFKTFDFAVAPQSAISQISNVAELQKEWDTNSTNENVINVCGRLITREEYEGGYSNYDYTKYKPKYNDNNNNTDNNSQPYQQGYQQFPQQGYQQFPQQGYPQQGYQQPQYYQPTVTQQPSDNTQYGTDPWAY